MTIKKIFVKLAVLLVVVSIVGGLYRGNVLSGLEYALTDRITIEPRSMDPRILIVGIDEYTLSKQNKNISSWKRGVYAQVAEQAFAGGAAAVWLDIMMTGANDSADNSVLEKSLEKFPNLILSAEVDRRQGFFPSLRVPQDQLAHLHLGASEGVVRKLKLSMPLADGSSLPAASVKLANKLLAPQEQLIQEIDGSWSRGGTPLPVTESGDTYFSFAQPPVDIRDRAEARVRIVSLQDVLDGLYPPELFHDSAVLVGAYAPSVEEDRFFTPISPSSHMPGVLVHANALQSLLDGKLYAPLSNGYGLMLIAALTALALLAFGRARPAVGLILLILFAAIYMTCMIFTLKKGVLWPLSYPFAAMLLAYVSALLLRYAGKEREHRRLASILARYIPRPVAEELARSSRDLELGGQRKEITVLFVDIRGFTTISEQLQPEEVVGILNRYMDLCASCIFAQGGTVDKYIGDGVMALFGAPATLENHAESAVRAALSIRKRSGSLKQEILNLYGQDLSFGIGIHSGEAVVGNIGSASRMDYTAIGDTVNTAARLESKASAGSILISHAVLERLGSEFQTSPRGEAQLKGKKDAVAIYEAENEEN